MDTYGYTAKLSVRHYTRINLENVYGRLFIYNLVYTLRRLPVPLLILISLKNLGETTAVHVLLITSRRLNFISLLFRRI